MDTKKTIFFKRMIGFVQILPLVMLLVFAVDSQAGAQPSVNKNTNNKEIAVAYLNLGSFYLTEKQFDQAKINLDIALKYDPENSEIHRVFGILYQRIKNEKLAEQSFERASRLAPKDAKVLNAYGQFLCSIGDLEKAKLMLLTAASDQLNPARAVAYANLGLCYLFAMQENEAEQYFLKSLEIASNFAIPLLEMAQISYDKGNIEDATSYMNRYRQLANPSARQLWLSILIARDAEDLDQVSSDALALRKNFPDSQEATLLTELNIR